MSYYYCKNCGDGPHNASLNPYCPNCFVLQINASQCNSYDHHVNSYPLSAYPNPQLSRSMSTRTNSGHAQDPITYVLGHTTRSSSAGTSTAFPTGNTPYSTPYSQRPERPPVYRWQCCKCGGDNSYATDQGCATCCDHWRNTCCHVYDSSNKRR